MQPGGKKYSNIEGTWGNKKVFELQKTKIMQPAEILDGHHDTFLDHLPPPRGQNTIMD